jgi:hypothetical protein
MKTSNRRIKINPPCRSNADGALDKLYAETFTPREMEILKNSTSNFDFHYMGSAKIMARIGKRFAEALFGTMEEQGEK